MSNVDDLKTKLGEWNHRLNGPNVQSISVQLGPMLWRSAFYRALNESRRYLPDSEDGRKVGNGSLHELIDDGYFILNAMAVRRLIDVGKFKGARGVYSLYGLLEDIADHYRLLTRENVLQARGLPYDFESAKRLAREAASRSGSHFLLRDAWVAQYWHEQMDKLSGVSAANRSPRDVPDARKMAGLLSELKKHSQNVKDWVDKFVAHAASPISIQTLPPDHQTVSVAKLWRAERVVMRVAGLVSASFIEGTNVAGVPIPQSDQFADLDRSFANALGVQAMHRAWRRHCEEIRSCQSWFWHEELSSAADAWNDDPA